MAWLARTLLTEVSQIIACTLLRGSGVALAYIMALVGEYVDNIVVFYRKVVKEKVSTIYTTWDRVDCS